MELIQWRSRTALIVFLVFMFLAFSCADKIKTDIVAFKALNRSLVNSNVVLDNQSQTILASLDEKRLNPATAEKATIWYGKAQQIQELSREMHVYIEGLKTDLKKEAGLTLQDGVESFKENDKNAVMRIFERNKKGKELFEHLEDYKKNILGVDSQIRGTFTNTLPVTTASFEPLKDQQTDFTKTFFDDIPVMAAIALLSKFQNDIKITENKVIEFCHNNTATVVLDCMKDVYAAFAFINSSYMKARDQVEITAGVGSMERRAQASIEINGKTVALDVDGAAHYKFKASDKPGKHVVPIEVSYLDLDGNKRTVTKNIEYTVADENK